MPLRPLTLGELLDAAVALLRANAGRLLGLAFVLSAAEQALLFPLRRGVAAEPPLYRPYDDLLAEFWVALAVGFATEAAILAVLGGLSAGAAAHALVGTRPAGHDLRRRFLRRLPAIAVLAGFAAVVAGASAFAGLLPWIFGYGLIGLIVPVLVVDRRGVFASIGRGIALAARAGLRGLGIRLVGYLAWLAIRLALVYGGFTAYEIVAPATSHTWLLAGAIASWLLINTLAYATLACLDAVTYVEARVRTEALDITIGRDRRHGRPVDLAAAT